MNVLFLKDSSDHTTVMWQVSDGQKWWTAAWSVRRSGWTIMGGKTVREVAATGRLGKQIIAAIEAAT
jgi:hypothetical protein